MNMSQICDSECLSNDDKYTDSNEYEVSDQAKNDRTVSQLNKITQHVNSVNSSNGNSILNENNNKLTENQNADESCSTPKKISVYTPVVDNDVSELILANSEDVKDTMKKDLKLLTLDSIISKTLTTSTVSLDDGNADVMTVNKSFSKSAEDISIQNLEFSTNNHSRSNSETINKDEVLANFQNQKSKVSATQTFLHDTNNEHSVIDVRYVKTPKEILTPDLGSIVKNVHGIFSTVSGSLKNAYNMSQKVSYPSKHVNNMATFSNGKILNEIFDDNQIEKTVPENGNTDVDFSTKDSIRSEGEGSDDGKVASSNGDITFLRQEMQKQAEMLQMKDQAFKDLEKKMELLRRNLEQAQKEKDMAVMRYASVECGAIEARKTADAASKAQKAAAAEVALAESKLKQAQAERRRLCQMYDDKCHELSTSERELSKSREELKELEGRLKWVQAKLRLEADAYKESAEKAERLAARVAELEAGRDSAAVAQTDSAKMKQLESDVKESQASLILARHQIEEMEKKLAGSHQQLCSCQQELNDTRAALDQLRTEAASLRESNAVLGQEAAELAALRARAALADTLAAQLQRESERASLAEEALSRERARADTCARREAAALEHAARLTAHHVAERAAADHQTDKTTALAADNASLRETVSSLKSEMDVLKNTLAAEESRRVSECKALARRVAELTEELSATNEKLEWERAENGLLKKRHATALKEVNRELQRTLKRCEQLEAKIPHERDESVRTGSVSSLSSDGAAPKHHRHHQRENSSSSSPDEVIVNGQCPEPEKPDRQALIERIVQLQRALARRADRCEFLEEHARHLTAELRRKCKLLRHALPALPAGALQTPAADKHKKEVAALGGGAMAAVWGAGAAEDLPPQLALEMNRRLHAVLEDALLKNITLKENLDTLGEEIARLKAEKTAH